MLNFIASPSRQLNGRLRVPGDKSISHRAIMLGALAEGDTEISGFLPGADCIATMAAFRAMGVSIEHPSVFRRDETPLSMPRRAETPLSMPRRDETPLNREQVNAEQVLVRGVGLYGLQAPSNALDLGNSGTAMRLLTGILAAQQFDSVVTGDRSLNQRPMQRIVEPLTRMGAHIETDENSTAPLRITGNQRLHGIDYTMPVASAQVKSCLLLAGLYAESSTRIVEPAPCRDHTERMLNGFGCAVLRTDNNTVVTLQNGQHLRGAKIEVPADISSAAFFLVAASIAQKADIYLENVGTNPTRTGIITLLKAMGADIELFNQRHSGGEPVADIRVKSARLHGIRIPESLVPLAIDEFPALFIAAAVAQGRTVLSGARELRVKESDRIQAMADGLHKLGVAAEPTADGIVIEGGPLGGGTVDSHGDHRIAMAFATAAACSNDTITIRDCDNVATSFPGFMQQMGNVGLQITAQ